ncbi:MAG: Nif11-like leader peptide family natural product precursor [Christensenellales bacterium]|nr:Nif11-like leader peptide family natural product precursor [Christensenellales bacterium]
MSNSENVVAFQNALKENEALRKQFEAALQRISENKEATCDGEAYAKAAAEVGFILTTAEMERFMAGNQTLDDDSLRMVVGGWCAFSSSNGMAEGDEHCAVDYHCLLIFRHTENGRTDVKCTSDYVRCWDDYVRSPGSSNIMCWNDFENKWECKKLW